MSRTLTEMTYREGYISSGKCSVCGQIFTAQDGAVPKEREWTLVSAFGLHECHSFSPGHRVNAVLPEGVVMSLDDGRDLANEVLKLREALMMLYSLLERYAPSWYTQEYHDKTKAALRIGESDESEN